MAVIAQAPTPSASAQQIRRERIQKLKITGRAYLPFADRYLARGERHLPLCHRPGTGHDPEPENAFPWYLPYAADGPLGYAAICGRLRLEVPLQ